MAPLTVFQFQTICVCEEVFVPAVGAASTEEFTVIAKVLGVPLPQALLGVTVSVPEVAEAEKLAVIELVAQFVAQVNPVPE